MRKKLLELLNKKNGEVKIGKVIVIIKTEDNIILKACPDGGYHYSTILWESEVDDLMEEIEDEIVTYVTHLQESLIEDLRRDK